MPDTGSLLSLTSSAGAGVLVPTRLAATEAISALFRFDIDARAAATIDPLSMLNQPACLALNNGGVTTRYFHGVVAEFGPTAPPGPLDTPYRFTLVPRLAAGALQQDCRLFFNVAADDILRTLFGELGVTDTDFRLSETAPPRVSTAQYNETALHFATRLMEEEGWYYFFMHAADKHTLVVTDSNAGFGTSDLAALRLGPSTTADMVTHWHTPQALTHGQVSLSDYDPDAPKKQLLETKPTVLAHPGLATRPVFHWPALSRSIDEVKLRAKRHMEAAEASASLAQAAGSCGLLFAGARFSLASGADAAKSYVVQRIEHLAADDGLRAGTGSETYANSFAAFDPALPWRQPMATVRPRMEGLHTAIVLVPDGEEIYTDEQGRIKVRFFWDWRQDATADNSAWVRVVQPWAGNGWGGQFIPRGGSEVAVAFMDADPDRPVVVGGFYNALDKPIFTAAEKTKLGFRSRSVLKGGADAFNEFSFDDNKGSEMVLLHAQKDLTTKVENDQTLAVDHDRFVKVQGKETVTVKGDRAHEVTEGNESLVVKQGNHTIEVSTGNQGTTIKQGNQTVEVAMGDQSTTLKMGNQSVVLSMGNHSTDLKLGDITLKADLGNITLQAMQSITLKVGTNTLTLSQTGIELKGLMVTVEGQISTEVSGLMTKVGGTAMLTLKGAITMIN